MELRIGFPRRLQLLRGESLIASLGVAAAVIIMLAMAVTAWWGLRTQHDAAEAARRDQVRAITAFLAQTSESMLAADELSALRRLVIDAKRNAELAECRIVLPDGRVIADGDPSRITLTVLPRKWNTGPLDATMVADSGGAAPNASLAAIDQSLLIPGRGVATLRVSADLRTAYKDAWEVKAGAGIIAALGLAALLLVYRQMRTKVITLGMIRDALLAIDGGERAREALTIGGDHGRVAAAWNALLKESEALRRQAIADQAKGVLDRRRESRGEMELACDSLSVGLVILDERGCVRHANGAAASVLRRKREELPGLEIPALIDHEAIREIVTNLKTGATISRQTIEVTLGDADQRSVLRVCVRPLRRDDQSSVLVTIEDVTQQRVAEEARNSFVAQATHELRTPLTNMRLCIETAVEEGAKDPKVLSHSLNVMNQETRRLERMVTEILSVAEIESGSLRIRKDDVRLDALFASLKGDLAALAQDKEQALTFELPPKLPVIQGDRDKLVLALHNVIGNAIKYTPSGGKVIVSVKVDAKHVHVDVSDTGIGIKPEEQALVFDRFYRSSDPRVSKITGSGLGLALAREVARLHGGELTVQSEIDKGSTFTMTLPVGGS
jgi:PAS domain S-box-containing protein